MHGERPGAHQGVHLVQPCGQARGQPLDKSGVGEVQPIRGVLRPGEVMAQHVEHMGVPILVEVGVERILGAREVALHEVGLGADDVLRVAGMPLALMARDVGHGGGPVVALLDDVDAHGAEAHRGLEHHRQRQVVHVDGLQLATVEGDAEQPRAQRRQPLAHSRLVLEQADGIGKRLVRRVAENPGQGVLGVGIDPLARVDAPSGLRVIHQIEGHLGPSGERAGEVVGEHRVLRLPEPLRQGSRGVGRVEDDHGRFSFQHRHPPVGGQRA